MKAILNVLLSALLIASSAAFATTAVTPTLSKGSFSQEYSFTTSHAYFPLLGLGTSINLSGSTSSFSSLSFEVLSSSGTPLTSFVNATNQRERERETLVASWSDSGYPGTLSGNTNYLLLVNGVASASGVQYALSANWLAPNAQFALVPAVPEPETYTMLIAGIGLLGVVKRRRKNS